MSQAYPGGDADTVGSMNLREAVRHALAHASHLLPDQAPIGVFIHHNTLHAFQHLPFHQAVQRGYEVYGAEPYLSEDAFRKHIETGRIREDDLRSVVAEKFPSEHAWFCGTVTEQQLRYTSMRYGIASESETSLKFLMAEKHVLRNFRDDVSDEARERIIAESSAPLKILLARGTARHLSEFSRLVTGEFDSARANGALSSLMGGATDPSTLLSALSSDPESFAVCALWTTCLEVTDRHTKPGSSWTESARLLPRDAAMLEGASDLYDLLFPALIRLSSAYLDDGVAHWSMPRREQGFYAAVRALVSAGSGLRERWLNQVRRAFQTQTSNSMGAEDVVLASLETLGVTPAEVEDFLERLLLTLPGWAGLMSRLERNPDDRPHGGPPASLLDFLAVRLTYELAALREVLARRGLAHDDIAARLLRAESQRQKRETETVRTRAYRLFQLMQLSGVSFLTLKEAAPEDIVQLLALQAGFSDLARRELFQEAFERSHRQPILDALAAYRSHVQVQRREERAKFQAIFCFDEREESIRRHLEEVCPEVETFGAPGFFGAAMRFRALDDADHVPLSPVVVKPVHHIDEKPRSDQHALFEARRKRRKTWAHIAHHTHVGTRSLWRGTVFNLALGFLSAFPLLTRVASPSLAGSIQRWFVGKLLPSPQTEVTVHHDVAADPGIVRGFQVDERVGRVATVLENIGFTSHFSKLVILLGHGSTTRNNPHKSAYDCGACGGRPGGPNARVVTHMANDAEVRRGLRARGIHLPDDTYFVGGQHDTCSDGISLFDTGHVPESHRALLHQAVSALDAARARNAQERCRRLFSAPKNASPSQALRHVEGRAEHLAQPRPEFGHATNAIAVIGRRSITRGLFLDRRAFLLSYDPTIDADGAILERTLAAATPVCAGINLEYYFSHVDNERYGAGSKLPHNVTGLVGVMTGHASDLRTGLPRQMIEIHEPVRLLVIVEATPQRLLDIAGRQAEVRELVVNRWVQLVSLDPSSGAMSLFTDQGFVPYTPSAIALAQGETSKDLYFRKDGFLPPARIAHRGSTAA